MTPGSGFRALGFLGLCKGVGFRVLVFRDLGLGFGLVCNFSVLSSPLLSSSIFVMRGS